MLGLYFVRGDLVVVANKNIEKWIVTTTDTVSGESGTWELTDKEFSSVLCLMVNEDNDMYDHVPQSILDRMIP